MEQDSEEHEAPGVRKEATPEIETKANGNLVRTLGFEDQKDSEKTQKDSETSTLQRTGSKWMIECLDNGP